MWLYLYRLLDLNIFTCCMFHTRFPNISTVFYSNYAVTNYFDWLGKNILLKFIMKVSLLQGRRCSKRFDSHNQTKFRQNETIISKALKFREKKVLAQFSTKLNETFIKFWEYLDTKITKICAKKILLKYGVNAIFFQETYTEHFISQE